MLSEFANTLKTEKIYSIIDTVYKSVVPQVLPSNECIHIIQVNNYVF